MPGTQRVLFLIACVSGLACASTQPSPRAAGVRGSMPVVKILRSFPAGDYLVVKELRFSVTAPDDLADLSKWCESRLQYEAAKVRANAVLPGVPETTAAAPGRLAGVTCERTAYAIKQ
jgi:hypothetical protein